MSQGQAPANSSKKGDPGVEALTSFVDPDAWVRDLYGIPQATAEKGGSENKEKDGKCEILNV